MYTHSNCALGVCVCARAKHTLHWIIHLSHIHTSVSLLRSLREWRNVLRFFNMSQVSMNRDAIISCFNSNFWIAFYFRIELAGIAMDFYRTRRRRRRRHRKETTTTTATTLWGSLMVNKSTIGHSVRSARLETAALGTQTLTHGILSSACITASPQIDNENETDLFFRRYNERNYVV